MCIGRIVSIVIVSHVWRVVCCVGFFFQAEDGIRDLVRSRGLGDVYKRQALDRPGDAVGDRGHGAAPAGRAAWRRRRAGEPHGLSLIHI